MAVKLRKKTGPSIFDEAVTLLEPSDVAHKKVTYSNFATNGLRKFIAQTDYSKPFYAHVKIYVSSSTAAINQVIECFALGRSDNVKLYGFDSTRTTWSGNSGIYSMRAYAPKDQTSTYANYAGGVTFNINSTTARNIEVEIFELENCTVLDTPAADGYNSTYHNNVAPGTCSNRWFGADLQGSCDASNTSYSLKVADTAIKTSTSVGIGRYTLYGYDTQRGDGASITSTFNSTGTSHVVNTTTVFNFGTHIMYNNVNSDYATSTSSSTVKTSTYSQYTSHYNADLRYSCNCGSTGFTIDKPLYLRVTPDFSTGTFTIHSDSLTQTLTNGGYYIYVGIVNHGTTYRLHLMEDQKMYYYNGTNLIEIVSNAADSSKLNGQEASYYLNYNNLSNKLTAGTGLTLSGTQFSVSSANASTILNLLSLGDSTPTDNDYYISQYVGGGTTQTSYHRRPMSALWSYVKGKADSVYQPKGTYATETYVNTAIASVTDNNYYPSRSYSSGLQISTSTNVTNTCALYVPYATADQYGVVKPAAVRSSAITATTGGTTSDRYYGVEKDSNGKLFVNVPWSSGTTTWNPDWGYTLKSYQGATFGNCYFIDCPGSYCFGCGASGFFIDSASIEDGAAEEDNMVLVSKAEGLVLFNLAHIQGIGIWDSSEGDTHDEYSSIYFTDIAEKGTVVAHGKCDTAYNVQNKAVTVTGLKVTNDAMFILELSQGNQYSSSYLNLNVNDSGNKKIYINDLETSSSHYAMPQGKYLVKISGSYCYCYPILIKETLVTASLTSSNTIGTQYYNFNKILTIYGTESSQNGTIRIQLSSSSGTTIAQATGEQGYWAKQDLCVTAFIPAGYNPYIYLNKMGTVYYRLSVIV